MFRHDDPAIRGGNIANIHDHIQPICVAKPTVAKVTVECIALGYQCGNVHQFVTRETKGQSIARGAGSIVSYGAF